MEALTSYLRGINTKANPEFEPTAASPPLPACASLVASLLGGGSTRTLGDLKHLQCISPESPMNSHSATINEGPVETKRATLRGGCTTAASSDYTDGTVNPPSVGLKRNSLEH